MIRVVGFKLSLNFLVGMGVIAIVVAAVEFYADRQGLSYKELIVGLGVLVAAIIIFGGERGIRFGLVLWVLSLALGYRTIEWTKNLRIHPSEILIWLLFMSVFAQRQLRSSTRFSLPWRLWLLFTFCELAWWPFVTGYAPWERILIELRAFCQLSPRIIGSPGTRSFNTHCSFTLLQF